MKEDSTTTEVRVVFDGSAKTSSGVFINKVQYVGPVVQDDLFTVLIRFRKHKYVISADIKQMYRQVLIQEDQRKYQRILWRETDSSPISKYQLNTITYGMASAPYLATRSLQQIAREHTEDYPIASKVILHDFYMDDLLSGAESIQEARELKQTLVNLLMDYGFELRKWASNNEDIVTSSVDESRQLPPGDMKNPKTLGLLWNPTSDTLKVSSKCIQVKSITKRTILSVTASIFDPLGLIAPIVINAKLILQRLWQLKLSWDEALPQELHTTWERFHVQLNTLDQIEVPRHIVNGIHEEAQLHGFSDASEKAFGACVYVRIPTDRGAYNVSLVCAKSRVAPLKPVTIPRLELCGALLLARLMNRVATSLNINKDHQYYWCDSTIVLCYIAADPNRWTTFVANRVLEIQETTNKNWNHVSTTDNPADLASRGSDVKGLATSKLWWNGPHWLRKDSQAWPKIFKPGMSNLPDTKSKPIVGLIVTNLSEQFGQRFSLFTTMVRVLAYILRFLHNSRNPTASRRFGPLSARELQESQSRLIKLTQYQDCSEEITRLQEKLNVNKKSPIVKLQPFLDDKGCLRVGGRLRHAPLPFEQKHPLIISHRNIIARRLIEYEHLRLLHAGPQLVLASVRTRYWITSGKGFVKGILRDCVKCFRANPSPLSYIMGVLPKSRVTPSRPFFISGVDYAGPFFIRERSRSKTIIKSYIYCAFSYAFLPRQYI